MEEIEYKYDEKRLIDEIIAYINKTYEEHYAQAGVQTTEFIIKNGHGVGFTVGNIMKYAQRYGKKEGRNRKDILKIIHYGIMLLYTHDLEEREKMNKLEEKLALLDRPAIARGVAETVTKLHNEHLRKTNV